MFGYLQSSLTWAAVWHDAIVAFIAASGAYVTVLVNRKRSTTRKAEEHKSEAEADKLRVESLADLYRQAKEARTDIAEIVRANAEEIRQLKAQYEKQVEFLRGQVGIKGESEWELHQEVKKVRARFHAAANEIQRCILRIRDYEEMMRRCDPPLVFTPFDFTPYEDLIRAWKAEDDATFRRA